MNRTILIATLMLAACGRGGAPDVAVTDAWARETRTGSTAAYLEIANRGDGVDRLVSVSIPPPAQASLHSSVMEDGISRMRPLDDGIEIAPGETVALRPGGLHVMVTGLGSPLAPGDALPLTLTFERSGERRVTAEVRPADAALMAH